MADEPQAPRAPFQFGLSSLLLIMTLVAVVMSVSVMVPGIGIALGIISAPALVRVYVLARRRRADGSPATMREKSLLFLACLGIATIIAVASGAAFFVACFVGFFATAAASGGVGWSSTDRGIQIGLSLGTLAGLPLLIYLLVRWFRWPKKWFMVSPYSKSGQLHLPIKVEDQNDGGDPKKEEPPAQSDEPPREQEQ